MQYVDNVQKIRLQKYLDLHIWDMSTQPLYCIIFFIRYSYRYLAYKYTKALTGI